MVIKKEVDILEENIKLKASCPVCGRNLFKATPNSYVEAFCPKCKSFLEISFYSKGVKVTTGDSK